MRLGAAFGAIASSRGVALEDLILWEPVIRGERYLDELESLDASMRLRLLHPPERLHEELAGFTFPRRIRQSVARIDLAALDPVHARRVLVLASSTDADTARLRDGLSRGGTTVQVNATNATGSEVATHIELAFA
jgi:hypothetical protein